MFGGTGISLEAKTRNTRWCVETVDILGVVGNFSSIIVDDDNHPHISYQDRTNNNLKYALWDGNTWNLETVDQEGYVGRSTSIDLDLMGYPHISYKQYTNHSDYALKYTYFDGAQWNTETVASYDNVILHISMKLDGNDFPHIAYRDHTNRSVQYAYYNGSEWMIETIQNNSGYSEVVLDLDSNDFPHIVYVDVDHRNLNHTYYDGNQWHVETIDTFQQLDEFRYPSFEIDLEDKMHVSYYFSRANDLKYGYHDGNQWNLETVDALGNVGEYSSITIGSDNSPYLTYFDSTNENLKYAQKDGNQWFIDTVDSDGKVGRYASVALGPLDNPHICYIEGFPNYNLKYAAMDIIRPIIEDDFSDSSGTTGDSFLLNITASDNLNVESIFIDWEHGPLSDNLSLVESNGYWLGNITLDHNLTDLTYTIYVNDTANNYNISSRKNVAIADNDLPELGVSWASSFSTGDPAFFSVNITDNIAVDDAKLNFTVDAAFNHNWSIVNQTGSSWELTMVLPDSATVVEHYFWVNDTSGNRNKTVLYSNPVTDNDRPVFGQLWNSELTTGDQATLSVNVSDNIEVDSVHFNFTFDYLSYRTWPVTNHTGNSWYLNLTLPHDLRKTTFRYEATDLSGNYNNSTSQTLDTYDNDPPELISDQTPPTGTTGDTFAFGIEVTDNIDVFSVHVDWTHGNRSGNRSLSDTDFDGIWTGTILLDTCQGPLEYSIHLMDGSLNRYSSTVRTVSIFDNDVPWLEECVFAGTPTTGDPFEIMVNASDNTNVEFVYLQYTFDDTELINVSMSECGNGCWNVTIPVNSSAAFINCSFFLGDDAGNRVWISIDPVTKEPVNLTVIDNDGPVAAANDDCQVDQHETVVLDGRNSTDNTGIVNYSWIVDTGEGEVKLYGEVGEYVFHDVGEYGVTLSVFDGMWNRDSANFSIHVRDTTPPTAVTGNHSTIDQGVDFEFNASGSTDNVGINGYSWSFIYDRELTVLEGMSANFTFRIAGIYTVMLGVTDIAGNVGKAYITIRVSDITPPVVLINAPESADQGTRVVLNGTSSYDDVGILNFTWSFLYDDSLVEFEYGMASFVFDIPGIYNITLSVEDEAGNVDSAFAILRVLDIYRPMANLTYSSTKYELGTSFTFDGSGSEDNVGIVNWTWEIVGPDGIEQRFGNRTIDLFLKEGTYTISLTVWDANGNEDMCDVEIMIQPNDEDIPTTDTLGAGLVIGMVLLIVIIVIGAALGFFFFMRRGHGKEDEESGKKESEQVDTDEGRERDEDNDGNVEEDVEEDVDWGSGDDESAEN